MIVFYLLTKSIKKMAKQGYQDKYFEEKFSHLNEKINHNRKNQNSLLNQILEQLKKINTRVDTLEDETRIFRYLSNNPKILVLWIMLISSIYISDIRQPVLNAIGKLFWL